MLKGLNRNPLNTKRRCNRRHVQGRRVGTVSARAAQQSRPPGNAGEVVAWAQQQFLQEVSRDKPDSSINLAKVCLLLALEEEAATQLESAPSTSARTSATASTWSLNRLDALAAEVVDTLTALEDRPQDSTNAATTAAAAAAAAAVAATTSTDSSQTSKLGSTDSSSDSTDTSSNSIDQHSQPLQQQQQQQQQQQSDRQASVDAFAAGRQQAQRFPMQVLNAVNAVLFRRHGYSACNRYGASVDSQLSAVLEDGPGSVAALTILYMEVCSRLGLDCGVKVVEDGRYCLVWPRPAQQAQQQQQQQQQPPAAAQQEVQQGGAPGQQQTLLSVGGDACVIDVYGEGALLPVREATELFGITQTELYAGSSKRELLAALLSELQTAQWCAAVGCSPSPALMTPLTAATAVGQAIQQLHGASIERAAAAAAKRVVLLPHEPQAQLDLALLCYFSGRYDDAWLELGSYLEQLKAAAEREQQQCVGGPSAVIAPFGAAGSTQAGSTSSTVSSAAGSTGGGSVGSSSTSISSRVTELHAAIQSMLIGGAVVPEQPPAAASPTAAEAALASADEEDVGSKAKKQQEQELNDIVLLFQKLQLELMVAANKEG